LEVFRSLGVPKEKRKSTYLVAFLSCRLCIFVLPKTEEKFIHPGTFEVANMMASGTTFSLAIPVLATIYHGLNRITKAAKPSHAFVLFLPLSPRIACPLLQDSPCIAASPSGPFDGVLLRVTNDPQRPRGCSQAYT